MSIWKNLSWVVDESLVNEPGLVESIMAVPEDNMSMVSVSVSVNI